ncbi:hypothetical protein ACIOBL_01380 [Paenibacillus taichungensis]|uniref:hypothetical protein n=1 Tax=Paenibacillus taichungensis TaxID=484184 RepID=UPI00382232A8
MKKIDADKLLLWMATAYDDGSDDRYEKGKKDMKTMVEALIHQGHFDQNKTDGKLKPGDSIKHIEPKMKTYGIGVVLEISKSGERALIDWPNYEEEKLPWQPTRSYFRIDRLMLVGESESKETAE